MPHKRQLKSKREEMRRSSADDGPVYFWKPEQENGFLGQWYESKFTVTQPGDEDDAKNVEITYMNCEHYMMHRKGVLFAPDDSITQEIASVDKPVPHPSTLRSLGRKVPNFDEKLWNKERLRIVVEGNYLKFTQNEDLKAQLLATGDRELIEASPRDRIWGVGFGAKNAGAMRHRWGLNLLGKALMEVRERIRSEQQKTPVDSDGIEGSKAKRMKV
ncbi:uncharacterized protein CIMG_11500 [Coccidioides immitis RS]|uniref:NADAR domain-containing protein n=4 Tax=Coccidioides TaxID=5500 RepID=A0A0D8JW42_COCIM|nr:hypothetical protein CPC735_065110 [Coccidioides posadasii C735 delta SOWgp]XP_012213903.1 uncharacterized protein CIMG_11500 [Coccidioides immitis RS]EFW17619.1 conserved hypothetical protein [Coccidioides posadasii str. Silveira]KMM70739.1 hypothetical protein CPAG_07050 [Coccidioides posadasii RMSCC 3488]EER25411.1 hypothetical protein CPC735_065110 [Coccidioides posadasii C735 delta SOWgp]KJF61131.1 hypothetical protein CIMG_11500 [Coccidioides immitis RS]QVM05596.1 hypothetical protei|eukprot:XP_003067556.1 hypothetical protein CPC735_065110 [Coccidioides posadasii C735 delta SOWgp]